MLTALTRTTRWTWITGNHDPGIADHCGGEIVEEAGVDGLLLRHEAKPDETRPELSGHYHPRLRIEAHGKRIARPCLVASRDEAGGGRMILPAFGALTGGMDAADPAILGALQPACAIDALVPAGGRVAQFPLWRAAA